MANRQRIQREVGYALLSAEGYETVDEVVFPEPGDMSILGVRTIEGFGVMVDNIGHRFVANPSTVAFSMAAELRAENSDFFSTFLQKAPTFRGQARGSASVVGELKGGQLLLR